MTVEYSMVQTNVHSAATRLQLDPSAVFETLVSAGVPGLYPDFQGWFFGKVVPGVHKYERSIIPCKIDGKMAGVAICKRTAIERKLCTLWVSTDFRTRGVATTLAGEAFSWLGSSKPLFTVCEEYLAEFAGLVEQWEFSKPMAYKGLYRTDRVEYVFNGPLLAYSH